MLTPSPCPSSTFLDEQDEMNPGNDQADNCEQVYDTDGNFLQRLDTIEMRTLLPRFLDLVSARFQNPEKPSTPLKLVDLGCGTGRNTIQLLEALSARRKDDTASSTPPVEIVGLDASPGMLKIARNAIDSAVEREKSLQSSPDVSLATLDLLQGAATRTLLSPSLQDHGAAGVISTLVLEHVPAKAFFEAASATMAPGGYLLVTNMHAEMGAISQAGFTDPKTGVKIRPTSYSHTVPDVLVAAREVGFQLEDLQGSGRENGVLERGVDESLVEVLGPRAKKWVGIKVWFGMLFSKRV